MESPILAGSNQFLYCMQAADADDSIVSERAELLGSFYLTNLERSLHNEEICS
jgi:hypothetical protein